MASLHFNHKLEIRHIKMKETFNGEVTVFCGPFIRPTSVLEATQYSVRRKVSSN